MLLKGFDCEILGLAYEHSGEKEIVWLQQGTHYIFHMASLSLHEDDGDQHGSHVKFHYRNTRVGGRAPRHGNVRHLRDHEDGNMELVSSP